IPGTAYAIIVNYVCCHRNYPVTVFNVFLGPRQSETHPEGYDRLFQVLDSVIDPTNESEGDKLWKYVAIMLSSHLRAACIDFNLPPEDNSPRGWVNYLIAVIFRTNR
ncbi:MAG: hypothetical protein KKE86_03885, partial [Planctomycetes bacterium]|nr:hypothetical protein [Planctomycetota bacterium]